MFYYSPGPVLWVTPLSAFATPVPPTASYYTVPTYYMPQTVPVAPIAYGTAAPFVAPVAYEPAYYSYLPPVQAPLPRGEYRFGRMLCISQ